MANHDQFGVEKLVARSGGEFSGSREADEPLLGVHHLDKLYPQTRPNSADYFRTLGRVPASLDCCVTPKVTQL